MRISKSRLHEIYPHAYDSVEKLFTQPKDKKDLFENYFTDKLWRLNNLYYITDVSGQKVKYRMFEAQHIVYAIITKYGKVIILKSRQQGISTHFLVDFFDDAIFLPNLTCGLMALGKDSTSDLLTRTKFMYDNLHPLVFEYTGIGKIRDNTQAMAFTNGSVIKIRNSFRSGTLQRLHISELGKIANIRPRDALETNTGSLQAIHANSKLAIESTAEGENMFKDKWDKAVELEESGTPLSHKDLKPIFLSWKDDPKRVLDIPQEPTKESIAYFKQKEEKGIIFTLEQQNYWIAQYRELGQEIFKEYPADPDDAFARTLDGSYYGKLYMAYVHMKNREVKDLYTPLLPVYVSWDLGIDDYTVMAFWQVFKNEVRLIDEYYNDNEDIIHYTDILWNKIREHKYEIKLNIFPHDVKVREMSTLKSRLERFVEQGIDKFHVDENPNVADGIDAVRQLIKILYIDKKCQYLKKCLKNYSKERDAVKQVWRNKPKEDDWAHGADAIRMFASQTASIWTPEEVREPNIITRDMTL